MINVTVTCDIHHVNGLECAEQFHCDGAQPEAPTFGPFLRSGWVQFLDGWTYRSNAVFGWLTLCPKHAESK
jgi:hypothetical protein